MTKVVLIITVFGSLFVFSSDSEAAKSAHVETELLSEVESIQPGEPFWMGVRLRMDDGWHTYWKNPGDSGLPTSIQWTLPEGFEAGPIHWPYPKRFKESGLATYGYEGEVMLLVPLTPADFLPQDSLQTLQARVRWLSCERICIPGQADLSLGVPVGQAPEPAQGHDEFIEARNRLPSIDPQWTVTVEDKRKSFVFNVIPPESTDPVKALSFFPEANDIIDHADPQKFKKTRSGYQLVVNKSSLFSPRETIGGVLVVQFEKGIPTDVRALAVDAVLK